MEFHLECVDEAQPFKVREEFHRPGRTPESENWFGATTGFICHDETRVTGRSISRGDQIRSLRDGDFQESRRERRKLSMLARANTV